jgi:type VI secretion system secreted protein Hcp
MTIYLKYGDVKGNVTTDGFKDWIECHSFHFGVARHIASAARHAHGREHSEPTLQEVTVTKHSDLSSPKLFLDAVAGKLDTKATLKFTTTTKGKVETFLVYEMENTGLSHYSLASSGDIPVETLTLNFTKITETFTSMDPGRSGSPETVGYDLTKMKTV